jgi:hypothetical protein
VKAQTSVCFPVKLQNLMKVMRQNRNSNNGNFTLVTLVVRVVRGKEKVYRCTLVGIDGE